MLRANPSITPPLQLAIQARNAEAVEALLPNADINEKGPAGWTALHQAAYYGDEITLRKLLENGAIINEPKDDGWRALHLAVSKGRKDIILALLDHGADTNIQRQDGWTPLHQAVDMGDSDSANQLLKRNANTNVADANGWTALHLAVSKGRKDILTALLDHGADPDVKKQDGWTPLHQAADMGDSDSANVLLQYRANPNTANNIGWTALHLAASKGYGTITERLLERGACVDARNTLGWTPLLLAVSNGHANILHLLLEYKAGVDEANIDGETPLHHAAYEGNEKMVKELLHANANQNRKDKEGNTPLLFAIKRENTEAIEMLGGDLRDMQETSPGAIFDADNSSKNHNSQDHSLSERWFRQLLEWQSQVLFQVASRNFANVRVAVLDTGVNLEHPAIKEQKQRLIHRINFAHPQESINDPCGHGTLSASLLLKVAPRADISVLKVWDDDREEVSAKAVTEAIRWATTWGVDIMSMSFGFRKWVPEIYTAILDAYRNDILMFAAASNVGPHDAKYPIYFPARLNGHVFCINSADGNGSSASTNPPPVYGMENFSILGEGVQWIWPIDPATTCLKSGSSIATPIAAGIAAFILEFARQKGIRELEHLHNFYGMRLVLREMAQRKSKYCFLVPWNFLDEEEHEFHSSDLSRLLSRR